MNSSIRPFKPYPYRPPQPQPHVPDPQQTPHQPLPRPEIGDPLPHTIPDYNPPSGPHYYVA
ncbi:MAG: hypothetical protein SFU83_22425 [Meiothermus sp.]|nr:hypothetical protein [Meiothermus sp.]